ncbi:SDR family oxidoreductase [Pedobacter sp. JCM 36344]|uniref:SDR family oxidoreductase n=1 Tax=Pedobacter sp. JCM 36344 TaxID=3374280 RepID=UPI00397C9991
MVKDFSETGYWTLILGGSSGLGLASAKKLASQGMNICILHRNPRIEMEEISSHFAEMKAMGVELASFNIDVTASDKREVMLVDLKRIMGPEGRVRCLIHSVAKGSLKPMVTENTGTLSNDDFLITMQNMAFSLYDWTASVFKAGLFASDARVISFTSEGSKKAIKNYAAVSAAKAALEAITRSIALEFAAHGIRANCIQAGITSTRSLKMIPNSEALIAHSLNRNPFKRLTRPEDVANVVYLLCKDEADWINGAILPVDGGETLN